jgi:NAD(P)-dependent dehydrogenase (short-subunit alcohol dehydrogenase family)
MPARKKATTAGRAKPTDGVVRKQRSIQREVDRLDAKDAKPKPSGKPKAVQAGKRKMPETPLPRQHLAKPGNESELQLAPRFEAPDYKGSGKLEGLSAIITGGDSGIGRAVAVLFAREGANVAIVYLDEHEDAKVVKQHVEAEGRECLLLPGDVKDVAFCKSVVRKTLKAFGRLDVLVNNAAFQNHCDRIEDLSDRHFQETIQTNIGGYFYMARAAVPHMKRGGSIINTGSETGIFGAKSLLDYSATKGAIHAFTKALSGQLLERGIRVNAVAPGPVWTPLNPADKPPKDVAKFGEDSDMGRPAQPEELSPAYVFLASPITASYISGIVLPVMGGVRG